MSGRENRRRLVAKLGDMSALGMFAGALALLVAIGFYVASRLAGERAYREKWKDYNDCGWA